MWAKSLKILTECFIFTWKRQAAFCANRAWLTRKIEAISKQYFASLQQDYPSKIRPIPARTVK